MITSAQRDGWLQHKIETKLTPDEQHDHNADTVLEYYYHKMPILWTSQHD